ncbi:hypothetical protein DESC_500124 [Desulfosarcina cetonica]|nr:hypothetical protein DESC_500124 [Desulfosarcina cetonica]
MLVFPTIAATEWIKVVHSSMLDGRVENNLPGDADDLPGRPRPPDGPGTRACRTGAQGAARKEDGILLTVAIPARCFPLTAQGA